MKLSRRNFLKASGATALAVAASQTIQWSGAQELETGLDANPQLHLANRLTWAARPEDLDKIAELGIAAYIDWQLEPQDIPDKATEDFIMEMPIINMSEREAFQAVRDQGRGNVLRDLYWARIYRAVNSERQLFEKLVEFWTDHFNVPIIDLVPERIVFDREVIRKNAMGKFRDLLFATAKSSAMLLYLDNASSQKEHPNENYARELLELHTLGVEGYSEEDVHNVAKAFTGWTLKDAWPGRFFFDAKIHDDTEKVVLGQKLSAGRGIEDGLQVLDLLATHSATANYISYKLCKRFIADEPPSTIVNSTAKVFANTDGDIKEILRHIFNSKEFSASQQAKFRRPIELLTAVMRVSQPALVVNNPNALLNVLRPMENLPYNWHSPDGYPDNAEAWINTNGLLHRWNIAMALPLAQEEWYDDLSIDFNSFLPLVQDETVLELINRTSIRLLGGTVNQKDQEQLIYFLSDFGDAQQIVDETMRADRLAILVSLILASPYFQWS